MKSHYLILLLAFMLLSLFLACSSSKLTLDQTFNALKPLKEIMTSKDAPVNLVIIVNHVADEKSSYKNTVEIRVNGKSILPDDPVTNVQRDFIFKLKLRPGYYKVEGKYFNSGGWDLETFKIKAHDLAKVMPNQRTVLTVDLKKNPDGSLIANEAFFTEKYEPLSETDESNNAPQVSKKKLVKLPKQKPLRTFTRTPIDPPIQEQTQNANLESWNSILLRIETEPQECLIRVDDSEVGQSPLTVTVNRFEDHILQVSKSGFQNITKILDHNMFKEEGEIKISQKLERLNSH